jgi:(2Fe-2S) ferredoxin
VLVDAQSTAVVVSVAIGFAVGGAGGAGGGVTFGGSGSISVNVITNTVKALIVGGSVTTGDTLTVNAKDRSLITVVAGAISAGGAGGAAGGGSAQAGASVAVNVIKNTVSAGIIERVKNIGGVDIVDDALVDAVGTVLVNAESDADIVAVSVGFAGGGSGGTVAISFQIAGSISINSIENMVDASIAGSHVNAGGVKLTAVDNSSIFSFGGSVAFSLAIGIGGGLAVGLSVSVNDIENVVQATIDDSQIVTGIAGVDMDASSNAEIVSIAISGAVAVGIVSVSAAGSVSVNEIDNVVDAHISGGSSVTSVGSPVALNATDNSTIQSLAGDVGFGVAGAVGASVATNNIGRVGHEIKAYIDNSLVAADSVALDASSTGLIRSAAVSGALAAGVTANTSENINNISSVIDSHISGTADVNATDGIVIRAEDASTIETLAGNVGLGLGVGSFGASVATNDIGNTIQTYITGSTINSGVAGVDLDATSNATITSIAVSGALSNGFTGNASVSVNEIDNIVDAHISGGSSVNSSGPVTLNATDNSTIESLAGNVGISVAAFGAAVATNNIGTNGGHEIKAYIDDSLVVTDSIALDASSTSLIRSAAVSGAVGAGAGIGASVSVNTIASVIDAHISGSANVTAANGIIVDAEDTSTIESLSGNIAVGAGALGAAVATNDIGNTIRAYITDSIVNTGVAGVDLDATSDATINSLAVSGALGGFSGTASVLLNEIGNTVEAYISGGSVVNSDGDISIDAQENVNFDVTAGAVSGGAVGIGASAVTATLTSTTAAFIGGSAEVSADGNVIVTAGRDIVVSATGLAGSGGIIALQAAVALITDSGSTSAFIGGTAEIIEANEVRIEALSSRTLTAEASGASVGGLTAGASVASATASGTTEAYIGNGIQIGQRAGKTVSDVVVTAGSVDVVNAKAFALAAGIGSGSVNSATATANPTTQAYVGDNADIAVTNDIAISAMGEAHSKADATGIALSALFSVGGSSANAITDATVTATIGADVTLIAGHNIGVASIYNIDDLGNPINDSARADSSGSAGSLLIGILAGSDASATSNAAVTTLVDDGSTLRAGNDANLVSLAHNAVNVVSEGNADGVFSAGGTSGTSAVANLDTQVQTEIGVGAIVDAGHDLNLASMASSNVVASSIGESGQGLASFFEDLFTGGLATFFSGTGVPSLLAVGGTATEVGVTNSAQTIIGTDAQLAADNALDITADAMVIVDADSKMTAESTLGAGGVAVADVSIDSDAIITVSENASVTAQIVLISALNEIDANAFADANVTADLLAGFSTGISRVNIGTGVGGPSEARVSLGQNSQVTGTTRLTIEALNEQKTENIVSNARSKSFGGAVSTSSALADGSVEVRSTIESGAGTILTSPDLEVHAESDYILDRIPDAAADTIVSETVKIVTTVVDRIVRWLPWPLNKIVRWVTRQIITFVEVFDFSSADASEGGTGLNAEDTINLNGKIANLGSQNRLLIINEDGSIDPASNVNAELRDFDGDGDDEYVVDDIINDGVAKMSFIVPRGDIIGNAILEVGRVIPKVEIINKSELDLVIQQIDMISDNAGNPDVTFISENDGEYLFPEDVSAGNIVSSLLDIGNRGAGDIIFSKSISNPTANFFIVNDGGDIGVTSSDVVMDREAFS